MRKVFVGLMACAFFLVASTAFGAVAVQNDGTYVGEASTLNINGATGTATTDGSTITITPGSLKQVYLPLESFYIGKYASTSALTPVALAYAGTTTPYLYSTGYRTYLNYEQSVYVGRNGKNASPIVQSFRVPEDYESGAAFIITCQHESSVATIVTPSYIDWDIVISTDGVVNNTLAPAGIYARDDQTPVSLPFTTGAPGGAESSLIEQVTLTYATPSDISPGDIIELRLWPAPKADSAASSAYSATQGLRIFGVSFSYTAQF